MKQNANNKKRSSRPQQSKPKSTFTNQRILGPATTTLSGAGTSRVESGQMILGDIVGNTVLVQPFELSELGFAGSRLHSLFTLYEKWFVKSMSFEFVPTVAKTQAGTVHICPEYDPLDLPPSTEIAATLSQSFHYKSGPVSETLRQSMPNPRMCDGAYLKPALFTSPVAPERWGSYGKVYVFVDGASLPSVGRLVMHYNIEFMIPQPIVSSSWVIEPNVNNIKQGVADTGTYLSPSPMQSSTGPNLIFYKDAAPYTVNTTQVLSGVISALSNIVLYDSTEKQVPVGTRIYAKAPQFDDTANLVGSSQCGGLNLSSTFDALTRLFFTGTVGGIINLAKTYTF